MLDVHVLIHPSTPDEWVARCMDSVREAKERAGFEVDIHKLAVREPHIGNDRARGYALGSHPYVTSVDDDDWVEPDAFACLLPAMRNNTPAIYTREFTHRDGLVGTDFTGRRNLRVFRRDVLEEMDFGSWPTCEDSAVVAHADKAGAHTHLPNRVYHYRHHFHGSRGLYAQHPDVLARAIVLRKAMPSEPWALSA